MDLSLRGLGGRKFILVIIVFLFAFGFAYTDWLLKEDFVSLTKMLIVAYPSAAIAQNYLVKDPAADVALVEDKRKFIFTLIVFFCTSFLFWQNQITGEFFIELCQWIVGIYVTGNVMAKAVDNGLNVTIGKTE